MHLNTALLRAFRKKHRVSQRTAAKMKGVSRETWRLWESGENFPKETEELASFLGVSERRLIVVNRRR